MMVVFPMPLAELQEIEAPSVRAVEQEKSRASIAWWALVALYVVVRAWNLTAFCLDSDEVFSITSARLGWTDLMAALVYDSVHPPLFYALLKLWIGVGGTSLIWVRMLPFALSVLGLVPLVLIFRKLNLSPAARALSLALIAVNEYQTYHARYVRMYSLLFLLSLVSLYLFLAWMEKGGKGRLIALASVNILLVYTHYYGWLIVLTEAAALVLWARHRLKPYAVACSAVLLAFVPWAHSVMHSAIAKRGLQPNLGWIPRPGASDLLWFYAGLDGPLAPIPLAFVMSLVCLALLAAGLPRANVRSLRVVALAATLPPALSFVASNILPQSVWGSRHLIVSAVPYMVLLAASVCALRPRALRHIALALLATWLAWGAYSVTVRPESRLNIEAIVQQLANRSGNEAAVTVYSLDGYLPAWMRYYLKPYSRVKWNLVAVRDPGEISGDHFWLAYNTKFWKGSRPEDILRKRGYEVGRGIWTADEWNRVTLVPVRATSSPRSGSKLPPIR
jgi:uncharacterized membrane protein